MADTAHPRWFEDGREVALDPRLWSVRLAEFLGCGFRVGVPDVAGELRAQAVGFVHDQVGEIARLLGAEVDDAPFAEALTAGGPLLLEGGWEPVFRGPLGPQLTRLARPGSADGALHVDLAVTAFHPLPWPTAVGSALSALPVSTVQADTVARRWLAETHGTETVGTVGTWRSPEGSVVASTDGNVLHRDQHGRWTHPAPGPGTVPTWLGERVLSLLGSTPVTLSADAEPSGWAALDAWGEVRAARAETADLLAAAVGRARHSL